jgi:SRSO17 transposase
MKKEAVEAQSRQEMEELWERIGPVYRGRGGREQARGYVLGLLSPIERKNGWQMAEGLGRRTPYAIQQFLYRGRWSSDGLRDVLRSYVSERIGRPDGVLVVDETGFLKQGKKSCGVMRQYSGTAGRVENCQVGVFLTYASRAGYTMLDRRLYLPKEWAEDGARRNAAGVPEGVVFQTKPQMALEMLQEAARAEVPFSWVAGDSVYGDYREIRTWLEAQGKGYVLCVSRKEHVWIGDEQYRVSEVLGAIPEEAWRVESAGHGSKGERLFEWALLELNKPMVKGWKRWLLIRRSLAKPEELRAYACSAPEDTTLEKLVEIAGARWTVETSFAESKGEVGLDQYEVRSYSGWYKHITLACIAHAFLTILRAASGTKSPLSAPPAAESTLDAFKRGRGLHP